VSIKKTTIILPSVLGAPSSTEGADIFRSQFGSWISDPTGVNFVDTSDDADIAILDITTPEESVWPLPTEEPGFYELTKKQTITISELASASETTKESWEEKVNSMVPLSEEKEYLITSFETPLTVEEALNSEADVQGSPSGVKYVYNYYDPNYEELLAPITDHEVIQNLYSMFDASSVVGTDEAGDEVLDVDTLPVVRGTKSATLSKALIFNKSRLSQRQKFQNQIVPIENMPLLADYEGSKYLFPMYVDINIPLDKKAEFVQVTRDTSMGVALTRDIEGITDLGQDASAASVRVKDMNFSTSYVDPAGTEQQELSLIPVKVLNLSEWVNSDNPAYAFDASDFDGYPLPPNFYFIGATAGSFLADPNYGTSDSITVGTAECPTFFAQITSFEEGMREIADSNRLRIRGIIDGKENYSETVMYKIQKFVGPPQTPLQDPIQTFHFMNSAEVDEFLSAEKEFKFVDTQVKYNQEYTYIVTAYQVVVGERYVYTNLETYEPEPGVSEDGTVTSNRTATIDVHMIPTIKLIETPLFGSTGRILDNPPLPPDVSFYPVVDDRNKIKVFFTTSTGLEDVEPITLNEAEAATAAQIQINQTRNDGKITFKSDDAASAFEVFRLDKAPVSIEDFSNSLFATAITNLADSPKGSSSTIEVVQNSNTKYYYMFRTIDVHGGISNPSAIYEIELYNDGGAGYPIIRHYDMETPDPKTTSKSARKIIQIIPRISQVYLNEEASGLVNETGLLQPAAGNRNIVLGNQDEPLFGKKFKVRLISKSTGKKVDLNINFKTKRLMGEIES